MDRTGLVKIRNAAVENMHSEATALLMAVIAGTKIKPEMAAESMKRLDEYRKIAIESLPQSSGKVTE